MYFDDDALLPENQDELIICAAPYGPEWLPGDFPEDIAVTLRGAGPARPWTATTPATTGAARARAPKTRRLRQQAPVDVQRTAGRHRARVPDMVLQVGRLDLLRAPEGEGEQAKWLGYDTRHLLAELDPKPDQVNIAINTMQMNITELLTAERRARHAVRGPRPLQGLGPYMVVRRGARQLLPGST